MTTRRLPRSARGRSLPHASGVDTVSWPPALHGRSTLLTVLLLGWLGGGLLGTAVAVVTGRPNDLSYGLTNVVAACVGLLLLVAAGPRERSREVGRAVEGRSAPALHGFVPASVPVQATPDHDDRRVTPAR